MINENPGAAKDNMDAPNRGAIDEYPTEDRVFLLHVNEVEQYRDLLKSDCHATEYAKSNGAEETDRGGEILSPNWWSRSRSGDLGNIAEANFYSYLNYSFAGYKDTLSAFITSITDPGIALRPVFWLNLSNETESAPVADTETAEADTVSSGGYMYVINVAGDAGALLRTEPSNSGTLIRVVLNGTQVERLDGTTSGGRECARIRLDNGTEGWVTRTSLDRFAVPAADPTAAASDKTEPGEVDPDVSAPAAASPAAGDPGQASDRKDVMQVGNCHTPTRLKIGDTVQLGDSTGLQMYMSAYGKPFDGWVVFPGKTAKVTDGPKCDDGSVWWEVDFLGFRGWVRENNSIGDYYLEKVN